MTFDRMVHNDKMKAKFNSQKSWSTLKVTGEGHRGQKTIENDYFLACFQFLDNSKSYWQIYMSFGRMV